jgi:hypothetical protein
MEKQEVTFSVWEGESFTIDFTKAYYYYSKLFSVSSFTQLKDAQAILLLKTFLKDFQDGKLGLDELCGLCYEAFFTCDVFQKKNKLGRVMTFLTELSFDLRRSPFSAAYTLEEAFDFFSLPQIKPLSRPRKPKRVSKKSKAAV